jgi:hypothetical protein
MKPGVTWLARLYGRRGRMVARAYARAFDVETAEGRALLGDLARYCRVGQTSFVAGDPHQTAFNEGARDVFLHVAELAGLAPADFPELFQPDSSQEVTLD